MVYRMYRIQKERRKMTDFAECSMAMQDFLMILLEICLILELILLLIRITCFYGKKKIITAVTVFAVSFMLMGFLMNDHRYCQGESAYQPMLRMCPASVLMAAMVVLLLYLGLRMKLLMMFPVGCVFRILLEGSFYATPRCMN